MKEPKVNVPPPPPPTPEERKLTREQLKQLEIQTKLLQEMQAEREALSPWIYKQLGLKPTYSPDGKLIKVEPMTEEERLQLMSPAEREAYENYKLMLERQARALKGELPVSPALEKDIEEQRKKLEEELSRTLGPDWRSSTPGIQAMNEFEKRAELLREEARRGELQAGTGLLLSRGGYLTREKKAALLDESLLKPTHFRGGFYNPYESWRAQAGRTGLLKSQLELQAAQARSNALGNLLGGGIVGALAGPFFGVPWLVGAGLGAFGGAPLLPFVRR